MFRSAKFRLTVSYLAIIMAICLLFSVVVYVLAVRELESSLRRETTILRLTPNLALRINDGFTGGSPEALYDASRERLVFGLAGVNAGILVAAGFLSYLLAKRTLRPIEAALDAQGRFASDASHELRTPLTAMKSEIEVALRARSLDAQAARGILTSNLEEIGKLEQLSAGLLKLAQQEGGLRSVSPCEVDDIVAGAENRLASTLKRRGITIGQTLAPGLLIRGDQDSLTELLYILLDNAVKYGPENSLVTVAASRHADFIQVVVSDGGPGIADGDLPHIFERFYRADASRSKNATPGYGLGLSIAERIVRLHHGEIAADNRPEGGARFTVRLPAAT